MLTLIAAIAIAMGVSFLCSVMEAALLSLNPGKLARLSERKPKIGKICAELKDDIEKPIAVILILNTTAHTFGAAIAGAQFDKLFGSDYVWLFSLIFTVFMVQYTEILPKTVGVRFNVFVIASTAKLLKVAIHLLSPLIHLVHWINRPFEGPDQEADSAAATALDEINALATMAREAEHITPTQEKALRGIPALAQNTIGALMRPLASTICVSENMTRSEVIQTAKEHPFSRFPVRAAAAPGEFLGILDIRHLLFAPENADWKTLIRPACYIDAAAAELEVAEHLEEFDSKLLLVRDNTGDIVGTLSSNDLIMKLFTPPQTI